MKRQNIVGFDYESCTCTKNYQGFQNIGEIHNDNRLKKCDLWLTCN